MSLKFPSQILSDLFQSPTKRLITSTIKITQHQKIEHYPQLNSSITNVILKCRVSATIEIGATILDGGAEIRR